MTISLVKRNPEIDQDRVFDLVDTFNKHGCAMFAQQQVIYRNLAKVVAGRHVLEAGCGSGLGTALLACRACIIVGTDKLQRNVDFAQSIYPWIEFTVWDLNKSTNLLADTVVCVEAFEHVENPEKVIEHLIEAAEYEVWISTPNGTGKPYPPENPYHVQEYTPEEMLGMLDKYKTVIRHWDTWELLPVTTAVDPLVYQVKVNR